MFPLAAFSHWAENKMRNRVIRNIRNCISALALVVVNCSAGESAITGNAVGDLVIGRIPPKVEENRLVVRRWESDENGQRYELLRVKVRGIEVDAEVHDGDIWRVWIGKAGLKTADGTQVGDRASAVLRKNATINAEIGPGPSLVLIPKKPCGISYVTNAKLPEDIPERLTRTFVSRIARTATIDKILVIGCQK